MLCGLGEMRSVEDLVQMLGRATFKGRSFFERNMGRDAKVQILIRWKDWDLAKDYYRFQDDVAKKYFPPSTPESVRGFVAHIARESVDMRCRCLYLPCSTG
jgi:hypothetical protein